MQLSKDFGHQPRYVSAHDRLLLEAQQVLRLRVAVDDRAQVAAHRVDHHHRHPVALQSPQGRRRVCPPLENGEQLVAPPERLASICADLQQEVEVAEHGQAAFEHVLPDAVVGIGDGLRVVVVASGEAPEFGEGGRGLCEFVPEICVVACAGLHEFFESAPVSLKVVHVDEFVLGVGPQVLLAQLFI